MNTEEIEKRLLGLDDEIHDLLRYIFESKELDVEVELKSYEDLKEKVSRNLKEPIDPTVEIRTMREKRYPVQQ